MTATKTFLPNCKITFHPMYPEDGHAWVRMDVINEAEKNQAEFIRGLQILLKDGIKEKWYNSSENNKKLLNQIRQSVGMERI